MSESDGAEIGTIRLVSDLLLTFPSPLSAR